MSKERFVHFQTKAGEVSADRKTGAWYLTKDGQILDYGGMRDLPVFLSAFRRSFSEEFAVASANGGD